VEPTYWRKQKSTEPAFANMMWSKPENKRLAGKLLIIGGNAHSISAPAAAYQAATEAGIGTIRVLLPDAIAKTIGQSFPEGEFAFSTPSGSFSKTAVRQVAENKDWADALLLAGDFGRNSETAIFIEQTIQKNKCPLVITQDGLDYFIQDIGKLTDHENNMIVSELGRLQKMTRAGMPSLIIQHSMTLHSLVGLLNSWTRETPARILTYHNDNFIYAEGGQVSTTPGSDGVGWEASLAAYAATWWLQNEGQSFEAVTTAIYEFVTKK